MWINRGKPRAAWIQMRSENSSSSPGESPQLGNPWEALLKNSLTSQVVEKKEKSIREKQSSTSNQSGSFSWKQLSFRKLSLGDRDGIPPLLRWVLVDARTNMHECEKSLNIDEALVAKRWFSNNYFQLMKQINYFFLFNLLNN